MYLSSNLMQLRRACVVAIFKVILIKPIVQKLLKHINKKGNVVQQIEHNVSSHIFMLKIFSTLDKRAHNSF